MTSSTVIAGTGVASVRLAQALRRAGYDGRLQLLGDEPDLPYDKPPLSKGFLAGTLTADRAQLLTQAQADEAGIELLLGVPAARLDVEARQVHLADSSVVPYDDLVIATGARARPAPWQASGVHVLRSLADCRALRDELAGGGPVAVIGAGFIGSEVASTCRSLGIAVTLIDPVPVPMARLAGAWAGEQLNALHERHGTVTRFGVGVAGIAGARGDLTVQLTDGSAVPCAAAVVGIGSQPNAEWLAGSGMVLDDGVVCDEFGRSSVPHVYALGDVARWRHPVDGVHRRAEHWTNAVDQARHLAQSIMCPDDPGAHLPEPFIWSDQYDWKIQVAGDTSGAQEHHLVDRSAPTGQRFAVLSGTDDHLHGGLTVNWVKASILVRKALRAGDGLAGVLESLRSLP
jgi:phthalate 3,4-dioxygenase ferredoxin reductase component